MATNDPASPEKQASAGRLPNGQFAPGTSGNPNGRPRGFDIRQVAEEHAAAAGVDLGAALWSIVEKMITQAKAGDSVAARLVLDRLAPELPPAVIVQRAKAGAMTMEDILARTWTQPVLQVITGVPGPREGGG